MRTQKIIAISNRDASNALVKLVEKKVRLISDVSSVVEIILRITRDVRSTGTYKRKHNHLSI
jgi:hypothetical protein